MTRMDRIGKVATTVGRDADGVLRVTYHATPVVTVYPNGRIVLDTGGWFTVTTRNRMNQAAQELGLSFVVYQKAFDWYVNIDGLTIEWSFHGGKRDNHITIRNGHD